MIGKKNILNFDWVLINKLGLGAFPKTDLHFETLKKMHIKSILTLCDSKEGVLPSQFKDKFNCEHYVLPDHRSKRFPSQEEIKSTVNLLEKLMKIGSVYVHCFAGVERSPLICLAYLMKNKNINMQDGLEYLMQIHPSTNPLKGQLDALSRITF